MHYKQNIFLMLKVQYLLFNYFYSQITIKSRCIIFEYNFNFAYKLFSGW